MDSALEPIVITGAGVLACNGIGRENFWDAIQEGRSGIGPIDRFDASAFPCRIGGQLWDFDPNDYLKKADVKRWHRSVHQSVAAAQLAVDDAELLKAGYAPERMAVGIGTSVGDPDETFEGYHEIVHSKGWQGFDRLMSSASSGHASTANVSARFHLAGPAITIGSGCATGVDMLAWGALQIGRGLADAAVVGATESPLMPVVFAAACRLGILSECNDEPEKAMRPFDRSTDALVLSEGTVVVVLERADKARARGARIFAEVASTGSASEANNPIVLERDGRALARAIGAALEQAGMEPRDVDCAHCHGVGLTMYDRCETQGYKTALGEHAYRIPISATKSMIGQAYATGGLFNVASAMMSLERGVMPPTINLTDPDPHCDLDYVPNTARINDPHTALCTALSFGGTHSAAILKRAN